MPSSLSSSRLHSLRPLAPLLLLLLLPLLLAVSSSSSPLLLRATGQSVAGSDESTTTASTAQCLSAMASSGVPTSQRRCVGPLVLSHSRMPRICSEFAFAHCGQSNQLNYTLSADDVPVIQRLEKEPLDITYDIELIPLDEEEGGSSGSSSSSIPLCVARTYMPKTFKQTVTPTYVHIQPQVDIICAGLKLLSLPKDWITLGADCRARGCSDCTAIPLCGWCTAESSFEPAPRSTEHWGTFRRLETSGRCVPLQGKDQQGKDQPWCDSCDKSFVSSKKMCPIFTGVKPADADDEDDDPEREEDSSTGGGGDTGGDDDDDSSTGASTGGHDDDDEEKDDSTGGDASTGGASTGATGGGDGDDGESTGATGGDGSSGGGEDDHNDEDQSTGTTGTTGATGGDHDDDDDGSSTGATGGGGGDDDEDASSSSGGSDSSSSGGSDSSSSGGSDSSSSTGENDAAEGDDDPRDTDIVRRDVSGLSRGEQAAIAIGSILLLAALVFGAFKLWQHKERVAAGFAGAGAPGGGYGLAQDV